MLPKMRSVIPGAVSSIGHDPDTNELHVTWKSGKRSVYSNVSAEKADQVMNAYSVGSAVHAMIKTQGHEHRYL